MVFVGVADLREIGLKDRLKSRKRKQLKPFAARNASQKISSKKSNKKVTKQSEKLPHTANWALAQK